MNDKEKSNEKIIEIKEEVKIGNVILEAGDRIKVLNEVDELSIYASKESSYIKLSFSYLMGDKGEGVSIKLDSLEENGSITKSQPLLETNFIAQKLFFNAIDSIQSSSGYHAWEMYQYRNYKYAFKEYTNFSITDRNRVLVIEGDLSDVSDNNLDKLEMAIKNI